MSYQGQNPSVTSRLRRLLQRMIFGGANAYRSWYGVDTTIDYEGEVGDAGTSDVVSSIVGWKQSVFPEAPLILREMSGDGKWAPVPSHLLLDLLNTPNELYDGMPLWKATIWDYGIEGNSFWMMVPGKGGGLQELHYIPRYMIEPAWDPSQSFADRKWEYTPAGEREDLPASNVLHFRDGIDTEDVRLGCSPLRNLFREMYTDQAAANVVATLLRNRAMPSAIVSPAVDSDFEQVNVQEVKQYFEEQFTGDNRGKPLVVGAPTKIETFGYSPKDLDVVEVRYMVEERIAAALNVPPIVVGLGSGMRRATYANVDAARKMAWENGMKPLLRSLANTLNRRLLPLVDDSGRLEFSFDFGEVEVLKESRMLETQRVRMGVTAGYVSVAEAREADGRAWTAADDVYLRSRSMEAVPVGQMMEAEAEAPTMEVEEEEEEEREEESDREMERAQVKPKATRFLGGKVQLRVDSDAFMADLIDSFEETLDEATTRYGQQIEKFFVDVGDEIYNGNTDSMTQWVTIAVDSDEELAGLADDVDEVFTRIRVNELRDADLKPIYEELTETAMRGTVDAVNSNLGVGLNLPDPMQRQVIADGGKRVGLIDLDQQSKDSLFQALHKARSEGLGVDDAAEMLQQHLKAGPYTEAGVEYRAKLVARTEAKHAQRVSALALYDEAGWEVEARDAQLGDDVSDPDCIARNGKRYTVEDAANETDMASVHPNCTLSWMPVVPES